MQVKSEVDNNVELFLSNEKDLIFQGCTQLLIINLLILANWTAEII